MKKSLLFVLFLNVFISFSQVGVNNATPKATIDISANDPKSTTETSAEGVLIPRVSRLRASHMSEVQNSTLIYIDDIRDGSLTGTTTNVDAVGFYHFKDGKWNKFIKPAVNIYTEDGSLPETRTVTQGNNELIISGNQSSRFINTGNTGFIQRSDPNNARVNIGMQEYDGTPLAWISTKKNGVFEINAVGTTTDFSLLANKNFIFKNYSDGSNTSSNKMILTNNGNLGIGVANPTETLHLKGRIKMEPFQTPSGIPLIEMIIGASGTGGYGNRSNNRGILVKTTSSNAGDIARINFGTTAVTGNSNHRYLSFSVGQNLTDSNGVLDESKEILVLTDQKGSEARVGIGIYAPDEKLHVVGNIKATGTVSATNISQTSDLRVKKDITSNEYGLNDVMKLKTVNYRFKDEKLGKQKRVGFIAQDVQKVIPELVTTANDEMQTLSVNYAEMTVILTKALQEQQVQINELKAQIRELQNKK
jgi:hypothetical protein